MTEMRDEVAELARDLVRIDTVNPPGAEARAAVLLAERLGAAGIAARTQQLADGRLNLIARLPGNGAGTILFSGHLDTVPASPDEWRDDPWSGTVRDGRLYGRGSCDMKGAVAAMAIAVIRLARSGARLPGDVVLAFTASEETDSAGADLLVRSGLVEEPAGIVIGEPTRLDLGVAHKGALWVEIALSGRAAHGSQPDAGDNAAVKLLNWLSPMAELEALVAREPHPLLAGPTMSLNAIAAGRAPNVVPDSAIGVLDYRTLPGTDHPTVVRELGSRSPSASVTVLRDCLPVFTDPLDPFVVTALGRLRSVNPGASIRALPYVTDASVFARTWQSPVVIVGPGDERLAHVADEWISLDALGQAVAIYERIALAGASRGGRDPEPRSR